MKKFRYIKVLIDEGVDHADNNGAISIAEIRAFDLAGKNLAFNKTVSVSSSANGVGNAVKIVDGSFSFEGTWATDYHTGFHHLNGSQWAQVDLGGAYHIKKIDIATFYGRGAGALTGYRVLFSLDGVKFDLYRQFTQMPVPEIGGVRMDVIEMPSVQYLCLKEEKTYGMKEGE